MTASFPRYAATAILLWLALTVTPAPAQFKEMTPLPGPPDISSSGGYRGSVVLGDAVYFDANDGCYGDELWKLDVLTGQTSMVKDIYPGATSSGPRRTSGFPANLPLYKGRFYFTANSLATSTALWRSDGTAEGTVPFYDFSPNGPEGCFAAGDTLYVTVYNTAAGKVELWKSDGTTQGTVKAIAAGGAVPDLSQATALGNLLVYPFENSAQGREMWRTDGTAAGTFLLNDINPGSSDSFPLTPVPADNKLYFVATRPSEQLWSTDGTVAGTKKVTQGTDIASEVLVLNGKAIYNTITPSTPWQVKITDGTTAGTSVIKTFTGSTGSNVVRLIGVSSDYAFFLFYSSSGGAALWKTDGTAAGTTQVKLIGGIDAGLIRPFTLGNKLFMVYQSQNEKELWVTDGTATGTTVIKDIMPGAQGSDPWPLVSTRGLLYFSANDGVHGTELWKTDGTAAGTTMVRDIQWTSSKQRPSNMTALGNNLLFCGTAPGTGRELWKYDAGTGQAQIVKDLLTGTDSGFYYDAPQQFTVSGPYLYLSAYNGAPSNLWRTDGTNAGTVLLQNASGIPNINGENFLVPFNGGLLFGRNKELWLTNGMPGSAIKLGAADTYPHVAVLQTTAVFTAPITTSRSVVHRTNGTVAGTGLIGPSGMTTEANNYVVAVNGNAFFLGADASGNTELWKSNGTAAGTTMVKNLSGGPGSGAQILPVSANNRLFLIKHPTQQTSELWSSDGFPDGTIKLSNLVHENFVSVHNVTALGNVLYYTTGPQTSTELWRSDGTPAGTYVLRKFTENLYSPVTVLSTLGSRILLAVTTKAQGTELWVTDGTAAGTKLLSDIMPGAGSSDPVFLGKSGTLGYFAATDPTHGREIWVTDGDPTGTRIVEDINPGMDSSFPFWVGPVDTRLFAMFERDPASGGVGLLEITPEITVYEGATPPLTELTDGQEAPVDFGVVRQSGPQSKVLTISNTGAVPLHISSVSAPPGYSLLDLQPMPATVEVGETLAFRLQLDAAALGPAGGRVRVESDDPDETVFDFPVSGTVVAPEIAVHNGGGTAPEITDGQAGAVDFGIARQATPVVRSVLIANTGTAPLLVSGVTVPAGYSVLNAPAAPFSVETGGTLSLDVRLDASAPGTFAGDMVVASDDLDEASFNFPLTGTVVTPEIAVRDGTVAGAELTDGQAAPVDFGRNVQGTPGARSITITNTGTVELKVSGVTAPPGYAALNAPSLPFLVGINQAVTFQVSLTTTTAGTYTGSVVIASDDLDELLFDFPVTGEVFIPDPASSVVSATTALNRQTGLREQTIHITNDTTATVPAYNLIIRGLPAGVEVNNASETRADGSVVVYIRQGMQPRSSQDIKIEYYSTNRSLVEFNPQLATEVVLNPRDLSVPAEQAGLAINKVTGLAGGEMLIEFTTEPGKSYQIQYSADGQTWQESLPAIHAAANRTQWIDRGLPRTDKHPSLDASRLYRVKALP
ncbi:MAG TPA: ELWxxDGT repeat protein [Verrucomicrobiales bacterium]|nr:ELWxxDGT repeat protein [Verrucomicrobiales bacterium]